MNSLKKHDFYWRIEGSQIKFHIPASKISGHSWASSRGWERSKERRGVLQASRSEDWDNDRVTRTVLMREYVLFTTLDIYLFIYYKGWCFGRPLCMESQSSCSRLWLCWERALIMIWWWFILEVLVSALVSSGFSVWGRKIRSCPPLLLTSQLVKVCLWRCEQNIYFFTYIFLTLERWFTSEK